MVNLRLPQSDDEMHVLSWRNSPQVAPFMYRDDPISSEEHATWFASILEDTKSNIVRIVEHDNKAVGLTSLTKIDHRHKSCEWGGYLAPAIGRGIGIGRAAMFLTLKIAFDEMNLNRVVVEVFTDNEKAFHLYETIGFQREGLLRERAWHSDGPKDVIVMALLEREWTNRSKSLAESLRHRELID
jgi:UDP-4-amino-4,6-dideoxy-N-acetyl-beta-L-altrosamine N-acetyltransferase